jgi:hypothetical protein
MNVTRPDIAVVHLVRAHNGIRVFRDFLDSYRRHDAGAEHELVLMLKGFSTRNGAQAHRELVADLEGVRVISVGDSGLDIGAYFEIAHRLEHRRMLMLNSFSRIQADGWLARMASAHEQRGVGIVGATGSWAAMGAMLAYQLRGGGPYAASFAGDPSFDVANGLAGMQAHRFGGTRVAKYKVVARVTATFGAFPCYSIRTNAFLLERELLLRLRARAPRDKLAALRLECGRRSITHQIEAIGLRPLVAGRDGAYEREQWPDSNTLWQSNQENLLVADNRTDEYERADRWERLALSRYAWGESAAPAEPATSAPISAVLSA